MVWATGYIRQVSGMERLLTTVRDVAAGELRVPPTWCDAGLGPDSRRSGAGWREGRGRIDGEEPGDTHVVLPEHVIRQR